MYNRDIAETNKPINPHLYRIDTLCIIAP